MIAAGDFVELRRGWVRVLVRADLARSLGDWLLADRPALPGDAQAFASGRGGAYAFTLPDGTRAVWREYRRGGWLARWNARTYAGFAARPFREVAVAAEARDRGVPTAEVLAARTVGRGVYRGAIVTSYLPETAPALAALEGARDPGVRLQVAAALGRTVGLMHRHGLDHADLNCENLLVRRAEQGPEAYVIDLDRARLTAPPVARWRRRAALRRLARSVRKRDPAGTIATAPVRAAFRMSYEEAARAPCVC